ncbi:BPSS1780 family membrane protein [Chromobacterium sp. IIBBL 290-4]|uniref:BPSS1780 family membrane protein n=1 Tax=Chromobacterium sp. IIBBL 290-4 TaxID=2953890 RepID=UPI0020B8A45C|nr:BPSS1780 family membrane protein [Chromobacterium sp. IIBBL 290-4]UTH76006.1 hypothetical protein NKT35_07840 [Chromobacterium sp. IIBBL 290-4]
MSTTIHKVPATHAWQWFKEAYGLFKQQKLVWIGMCVFYILIYIASLQIPVVGSILLAAIAPVFTAGLLLAARKRSDNQTVKFTDLFLGWRNHLRPLLSFAALMLPLILVENFVGENLVPTPGHSVPPIYWYAFAAFMLIHSVLMYAPALLVFKGVPLIQAVALSSRGVLKNWAAIVLSALLQIALAMLSVITLGLALIVLVPVMCLIGYTSWRDIYTDDTLPSIA